MKNFTIFYFDQKYSKHHFCSNSCILYSQNHVSQFLSCMYDRRPFGVWHFILIFAKCWYVVCFCCWTRPWAFWCALLPQDQALVLLVTVGFFVFVSFSHMLTQFNFLLWPSSLQFQVCRQEKIFFLAMYPENFFIFRFHHKKLKQWRKMEIKKMKWNEMKWKK